MTILRQNKEKSFSFMTFSRLTVAESHLLTYLQTWSLFPLVEVSRNPFSPDGLETSALDALTRYIERSKRRENELLATLGVRGDALRTTRLPNEDFRNYLRRGRYPWLAVQPAATLVLDELWQLDSTIDRSAHRVLVWRRNCGVSSDVPKLAAQDSDLHWLRENFLSRIVLAKTALEQSRDGREAIAFFFDPARREKLSVLGSEEAARIYCSMA